MQTIQERAEEVREDRGKISDLLEKGQYRTAVTIARNRGLREWLMAQCQKVVRELVRRERISDLRNFVADMAQAWAGEQKKFVQGAIDCCLEERRYDYAAELAEKHFAHGWLMHRCRAVIKELAQKGRRTEARDFVSDMGKACPERKEELKNMLAEANLWM